ncbi:hypothetical protein [Changpingibacter yushuensis]|uniref:hypothetical protein n=1 Tax=Changpingibacter yushuensis TaxID=2758440 RepID=UPI00165DDC22|nr:hypothetical protein [Changpingibacter yushuensis]
MKFGSSVGETVLVYENRLEIAKRTMLSLGLAKKTRTIPFAQIRSVSRRGGVTHLELPLGKAELVLMSKSEFKKFEGIYYASL